MKATDQVAVSLKEASSFLKEAGPEMQREKFNQSINTFTSYS